MYYYPDLPARFDDSLRTLRIISENLTQHPDYLTNIDCKYPENIKFILLNFLDSPDIVASEPEPEIEDYTKIDLRVEAIRTIKELQALKSEVGKLSANEQIATYRLVVTQLEKLIDLEKQAEEVDHYRQFKAAIFDALERHLTPAQISELIEEFNDTIR